MDHFDSLKSDRLRAAMRASREALMKANRLVSDARIFDLTSGGSGPSTEQTQALSQAAAAEQRATADYLGYLAEVSVLAIRRAPPLIGPLMPPSFERARRDV